MAASNIQTFVSAVHANFDVRSLFYIILVSCDSVIRNSNPTSLQFSVCL